MKAKTAPTIRQGNFLYPDLLDQLDPKDPLLLLAKKIPWMELEKEFAPLYAEKGRPAKPVRLMVGLLILKQIENLSDERVVEEWKRNPYFQAFCGIEQFQWRFPCEPSDLCHFRKRIGEKGFEKIFHISITIHGKAAQEQEVVVDTTVQEKNITFPTDSKLRMKVIFNCLKIAEKSQIPLRRTYRRELKKLKRAIRFNRTKNTKEKKSAIRRLKTIANILIRELMRKLPVTEVDAMKEEFERYKKAVNQKKDDKNKIYSLHEPEVFCIAKGKEHKKYEFGNKAVFARTSISGIVVGATNGFNEYDGDTLASVLSQVEKLRGKRPPIAICDRGFRGRKFVGKTKIEIPESPTPKTTNYAKRKAQKRFRCRSGIEGSISHLKQDFRMIRNYLKGTVGDTINILMSAAAFNFHKWMLLAARPCYIFFSFILMLFWEIQKSKLAQKV